MGATIVVGLASWADPGFVEEWYPPALPARERLPWYARHFAGVEVNSTFYAVPAIASVAHWAEQTPAYFSFDVKLHRLLSGHAAGPDALPPDLRRGVRVNERGRVIADGALIAQLAERCRAAVEPLREAGKLSSLLLQLTPAFAPRSRALAELEPLLEPLRPLPVAIELRHRGWLDEQRREQTLGWFEAQDVAFVCVDAPTSRRAPTIMPPLDAVTRGDLAYLRAHGRDAERYLRGRSVAERFGYRYSRKELRELAARAHALAEQAETVRVVFNNNRGDDAPRAALELQELLGGAVAHAA